MIRSLYVKLKLIPSKRISLHIRYINLVFFSIKIVDLSFNEQIMTLRWLLNRACYFFYSSQSILCRN